MVDQLSAIYSCTISIAVLSLLVHVLNIACCCAYKIIVADIPCDTHLSRNFEYSTTVEREGECMG